MIDWLIHNYLISSNSIVKIHNVGQANTIFFFFV